MKMTRLMMEEYLDGGLLREEVAVVELAIKSDVGAARMLASVKSERALRGAVYASYVPNGVEARAFAGKVLAGLRDERAESGPIGRIGYWVKHAAAVAAMVVFVAGIYEFGRLTGSHAAQTDMASAQVIYRVLYTGQDGDQEMKEFASVDDANNFVKQQDVRHTDPVMISANKPDDFDVDSPGQL